jgi:hypothetical protein
MNIETVSPIDLNLITAPSLLVKNWLIKAIHDLAVSKNLRNMWSVFTGDILELSSRK